MMMLKKVRTSQYSSKGLENFLQVYFGLRYFSFQLRCLGTGQVDIPFQTRVFVQLFCRLAETLVLLKPSDKFCSWIFLFLVFL